MMRLPWDHKPGRDEPPARPRRIPRRSQGRASRASLPSTFHGGPPSVWRRPWDHELVPWVGRDSVEPWNLGRQESQGSTESRPTPVHGQGNANVGVNRSGLSFFAAILLLAAGCGERGATIVIYTSQDQVYAEPILQEFTRQTGIKALAVYDSEAVKTVGLVGRLLAEQSHPQCDVFWNNEELRTRQLAARGLFREQDPWRSFGVRSRRLVINTNQITVPLAPSTLQELTHAAWRGKVALAYPLFGTTATHFLALRQHWGEARWTEWCRALQANRPFLVEGNSAVVRMVGQGEAWIGLTDSDDILAGQREGWPVAALPLSAEMLLIPNSVAIIRHSPHPEAAQKLSDYLLNPAVADKLVAANALESRFSEDTSRAGLRPDWGKLVEDLEPATQKLKEIFLR